jgi:hypothetical protein
VLDAALRGVELSPTDRRFLVRLSQWDKRSATTVASLIARAREQGRQEAGAGAAGAGVAAGAGAGEFVPSVPAQRVVVARVSLEPDLMAYGAGRER